jgi:diaminopimelate epimerase
MQDKSGLSFWKLHGCGNNIVIIDDSDHKLRQSISDISRFSRKVLDPSIGIAGENLVLIQDFKDNTIITSMFNPDGSPSGMCGNATRCIVRALYLEDHPYLKKLQEQTTKKNLSLASLNVAIGVLQSDSETMRVVKATTRDAGKNVTVDMGRYSFEPQKIPLNSDLEWIEKEITCQDGSSFVGSCVELGNPHLVIFVKDLKKIKLAQDGSMLENHSLFPKRINVHFVKKIGEESFEVLVWERGAGATKACGSGACAVTAVARRLGFVKERATIHLPGGELKIEIRDGILYKSGPSFEIAKGYLTERFLGEG